MHNISSTSKHEGKFEGTLRYKEEVMTNLEQHIKILLLDDFVVSNVRGESHIFSGMSLREQRQENSLYELSN